MGNNILGSYRESNTIKDSASHREISLACVGDISFKGRIEDEPSADVFLPVAPIFRGSDFIVGNLESPLTPRGLPGVPGKCCLRGSLDWADVLKRTGISLVSLANNHVMDFGSEGLFTTIEALREAGVKYVGAGENLEQACKPSLVCLNELKIAFLARTMVFVSSPSYAGVNKPGVARFDFEETRKQIKTCREKADFVVLLLHWGLEYYHYPTPKQKEIAKELFNSGADIIFGSHPHVLQGMETVNKKFVFYSMGNFLFYNFEWSYVGKDGSTKRAFEELNNSSREAGIFKVVISGTIARKYQFIPTIIGLDGTVRIDQRTERIRRFSTLSRRIKLPLYPLFWRCYSARQEWNLRLKSQFFRELQWKKIKKLRLRHFRVFLDAIRRSSRIVSEKSTNPYE